MTTVERHNPSKKIVLVDVHDLTVDPDYQRPLNTRRSEKMANDWDDRIFQLPLLNRRDGKYFIVDGQHSVEGSKAVGFTKIQAFVLDPPVSKQEEAAIFDKANGSRVAVRAYDKFLARRTSGSPSAIAIMSILERLGLELISGGNTGRIANTRRSIGCTTAMELAYANVEGRLKDVLEVISDAFGWAHDSYKGPIVIAVARVIHAFPGIDLARLSTRMRDEYKTARDLERAALGANRLFTDSKRDFVIAKMLLSSYNKKLSASNRLDEAELVKKGSWIGK